MRSSTKQWWVLAILSAVGSLAMAAEGPMFNVEVAPMASVVEANNRFALDLYARLRSHPGNLFFSPGSISTALAMTYAGARGETADQMARVLHLAIPQEQVAPAFRDLSSALQPAGEKHGYRLSVANRLWGQQGYHFLPDFLAVTRDFYQAELAEVDFVSNSEEAREDINRWVEQQTQDKIKDLVPQGSLSALTRLVLTNAIYFKGDWIRPFPKEQTREEPFYVTSRKTARVPLMHLSDDLRFAEVSGIKLVELPYGKGDLVMIVLLPDEIDGLPTLEGKLDHQSLERWTSALRTRKVRVSLPRFKLESQFSLASTLSALGMPLAFDQNQADFSGISTQEKLYLSAVLHKAFVDVNEEGTEAAAATAVVVGVRAVIREDVPAVIRADHPFLYLIRDRRTGCILFLGRVLNPAA